MIHGFATTFFLHNDKSTTKYIFFPQIYEKTAIGRENEEVSPIRHKFLMICLSLALAVALFTGVFAVMGWGSLLRDVGSAVIYPFQWVWAKAGDAVQGFGAYFSDIQDLQAQIDALEKENQSLKDQLVDAELLAEENKWLYHYLSMKEEHGDYGLCGATVIACTSSSGDYVTEITLNRGTSSGVETGMPVVTVSGLVGVVVETGVDHCLVSTILDPSVSVGAVTSSGAENGLCEGDYAQALLGNTTLRYLREEADVVEGDTVITSGRGSVYPYGIPIGRITSISFNPYSRTTEAVVQPFTDFSELTRVLIMTSYTHYVDGFESGDGGGG